MRQALETVIFLSLLLEKMNFHHLEMSSSSNPTSIQDPFNIDAFKEYIIMHAMFTDLKTCFQRHNWCITND